jgi:type IV pilus assembly protein PilQ
VEIRASRAPSYTVFKLQDPPRLVVDIAGGDVSSVHSPVQVSRGGVVAVSTAQYKDEKSAVGRVIVSLDPAARYEVTPRGESVVVRVQAAEVAAAPAALPVQAPAPAQAPLAVPVAAPAAGDHVVSRRTDEAAVKHPATAVTGARARTDGVVLLANGQIGKFEVIELRDPPRLAIDLYGVEKAPRSSAPGAAGFKQVRFGRDQGKVRVVLDADGDLPAYQVKRTEAGLAVLTRGAQATAAAPAAPPAAPAAPQATRKAAVPPVAVALAPPEKALPPPVQLQDVRVNQAGAASRIEIVGKAPHAVSRPDPRTLVLTLEGARLPKRLERALDTSALGGPVTMVSCFNTPSTGQVQIVATLRSDATDKLAATPSGLAWTVSAGVPEKPDAEQPVVLSDASAAQGAGFSAATPGYALSGVPQQKQYTGRRITLDFHDIDIRNLLRLIADVSKKNIVVAEDVTGKVTVSLRNVPWDQALDIVLRAKGLDKEETGNVIRVAKIETIAKEQQARADAAKARLPLIPLKVRLIPVNFAHAADVTKQVKEVLTERGTVSVDERTNVLIVKDTQEALARVEGLVRNLDTETPQVLIESRIVEAASNFLQAIGVQWGGNTSWTQATGNPTGAAFPNNFSMVGGSGGGPTTGTASTPNYAVNLPAPVGQGSGGAIGFALGSASNAFNLNLRLTALENTGVVKTISAPKVATLDNKEAIINQGLSIPFSQVSASGVNTTFVEALLELKVTPHVTADGSILMRIKATNNQPNPQLTGANGQPSISKRQAETQVLVKDGDTTVIGGIYTRQTAKRVNKVPFLGDIPILGFFFKSTADTDDHTELLIFITPRVLNRPVATAAAGG